MNTDVRTQQGVVRGTMAEGVAVLKGIPYVAPIVFSHLDQPSDGIGYANRSITAQPFPSHLFSTI